MGFKRGQLRDFVAVAEAGQVTTAARGLGLPQPLLSQSIRQLEHELGVELLEREPRGVKLTPAGEAFIPKARASLAAHADALSTAEALRRAASDTIDIGFLGAPPVGHCAGLIEAFTDSYPEVDVRFRELPLPSAPMDSWL
ncbi:MAG TPA: LysR family transcriptional regulator, partial [Solirubrobacteraceae bacterium]